MMVHDELIAALRTQGQCDEDGVMCRVSRQAVNEAIEILSNRPAAPVELPVVGWIRGSGLQMLKDGYAATLYVDERDSNNSQALVKLSDAQAAIAAAQKGSS